MAAQFDPFSKEENPLSIIDSAPLPIESSVSMHTPTDLLDGGDVHEEVQLDDEENSAVDDDSDEEEYSSDDDENYPVDFLDTEGWNRRRVSSSDSEEMNANQTNNDLAEYGLQQGEARGLDDIVHNRQSSNRRGLFGWGRRTKYIDIPSDGIDEAAVNQDADDDDVDEELEEAQKMDNELRPGDHIYVWQTHGINPRAYQRHAVVLSVRPAEEDSSFREASDFSYNIDDLYNEDRIEDVEVIVVSFYHFQRTNGNKGERTGCKTQQLKEFIGTDGLKRKKPVHKVRYGATVKRGILSQKVIGTALKKDVTGLILARVQYLLDNPSHLPDHNALSANGECAALWCVTGRWCTLQGASILQITCVGQAGGALVAGGILSNLTVLVPMPGLWGMAGWWWYVPATVAYPFLVPMLVALGMCSLVPLEILRRNRKRWRGLTDGLNHEFWSNASDEVKEEYFGQMATAEREAEMRSFFGVREGETVADDAKYMPVGGSPAGVDNSDDEEDEALALQKMEKRCQTMMSDMNVDLSGRPPDQKSSRNWGSLIGNSFRKKVTTMSEDAQIESQSII